MMDNNNLLIISPLIKANLKRFCKDGVISSDDSEVKEAASRYFC
jgi:hypothetical protein